ncbi:MAG: type II toxin-antitoxin system MqsA family antitoxin [Myxococcota bacterium]
MSKSAFDRLKAAMEDTIAYAEGDESRGAVAYPPPMTPAEIKEVRHQLRLTQKEFAVVFRVGLGTVRHWERGDRTPEGPARTLLRVIQREPEAVLRALAID